MRMKWARIIAQTCCSFLGTALLFIAVFATQLHIDKNGTWGPNRIGVAILGAIFVILAIVIFASKYLGSILNSPTIQRSKRYFQWITVPFTWLMKPGEDKPESKHTTRKTGWYAASGSLLVILVSLWYITSGRMVTWTPSTTYYDRLANAFMAGQLALLEKPPAALATLANPYQYQNREGIGGYLWDASYFNGNYYLYWGPVPGLMAAAVKLVNPVWVIEDQYLIMFAIAGLAILLGALFYSLQKKYFPRIPGWVVQGATLLGVLNTPVFWLVNRPQVYEASIATGQFFLMLGVLTAVIGMDSKKHKMLLLTITGFAWGAAIGSRIDQGFGIAWMTLMICILLIIQIRKRQASPGAIVAILLPLVLYGAGLAWYNYARFGNILETGHRYQLTGEGLPIDYRNIVSLSYVLPNLFNLLARPMEINWHEFPFFFTPNLTSHSWPKFLFFPRNANYFFSEPITGIFVSMPTTWFLLIPAIIFPLRKFWKWLKETPGNIISKADRFQTNWIDLMVSGAALLNLGVLSIYLTSLMRYEADLTPLLAIFFFLFAGWVSNMTVSRPRLWILFLILAGITILASILISLLTNFQSGDMIFRNSNPTLFLNISQFFSGK
jgi:hypothetical protein